MHQLDK